MLGRNPETSLTQNLQVGEPHLERLSNYVLMDKSRKKRGQRVHEERGRREV